MKVLIHCGAGNTDRPQRWGTIHKIFDGLGKSLIELGHEVTMIVHGEATIRSTCPAIIKIISDTIDPDVIDKISPDVAITWNGNSDGDVQFISAVGKEKVIYAELGFFDHYNKTCYFDKSGVNTRHSMIGFKLPPYSHDDSIIIKSVTQKYKKDRLFADPFIFVPLQDENDTQIVQYSPFKTMDEFLHHVVDIFSTDDRTILYKMHPRSRCKITINDPKVIAVTEDVHHYIPYADLVVGLNSTVMVETLLYHQRIVTYGAGIAARHFESSKERDTFMVEMYRRQMLWADLANPEKIKTSHLYKLMFEVYDKYKNET